MNLFATLTQRLTDSFLAQLAGAAALPLAAAKEYCALALPALVARLAAPADGDELEARWHMCRHLFLGQMLADSHELLRADMGWPDRRRYLAQKILGPGQVLALAQATAWPAQAETLLGYLTIIALATLGEKASETSLDPAGLGAWLSQQQVLPAASRAPAAAGPAGESSKRVVLSSAVGVLVVAGLVGGYLLLRPLASAPPQPAAPRPVALAAPQPLIAVASIAFENEPLAAPAEPAPAVAEEAPVAVAVPRVRPAPAAAPKAGLRDTVGNAALARRIGGKFNVALGRYLRGEGQPLLVKLPNRTTLTVGINSTENLLYKRLTNPDLPRPNDIALDRLAFDLGKARLGAEGAQQLGNVASLLKTFPKARLLVLGHANINEAEAIRLGLQRATTAVDELVKQGISASRLQAQGILATSLPTASDSAEKQAMLQGISLKISRL